MQKEEVSKLLLRAIRENRLHHAYLFSGPESPEKFSAVLDVIIHSAREDQEKVRSKLASGNHPDLFQIRPQEDLISVDQIRELPKVLAYPPLELEKRFIVIHSAEKLNVQSSNALLKVLEEPPSHSIFILLTKEPSDLLQTIQSRIQQLRFSPIKNEALLNLDGAKSLGLQNAYLGFSEGSFERAQSLLAQPALLDQLELAAEMLIRHWEESPRVSSDSFRWVEGLDSEEACELAVQAWLLLLRDLAFVIQGAKKDTQNFPAFFPRIESIVKKASEDLMEEVGKKAALINRFRVYREFHGNLRIDILSLFTNLQIFSIGKA